MIMLDKLSHLQAQVAQKNKENTTTADLEVSDGLYCDYCIAVCVLRAL